MDCIIVFDVTATSAATRNAGSETDVTLNWSTATETNNQGFDIERKSTTGQYEKSDTLLVTVRLVRHRTTVIPIRILLRGHIPTG